MLEIVRWVTVASTLFVAIFGYLDQLRIIISGHSTEGLSFVMFFAGFWAWLSYTLYGLLKKDHKIFWPNLIGTILVGAILISFLFFD